MNNVALKNMNPDVKKDFLEWEMHHSLGTNPVETMGKERAFRGYLADPTEQHARIMELRQQLNIKPGEEVSEQFAKEIINFVDSGSSNITPGFLKVFDKDPKKLAELFNKFWAAPVGAIGAAGLYNSNKKKSEFKKGGTYEIDDLEIENLRRQGYTIEYID